MSKLGRRESIHCQTNSVMFIFWCISHHKFSDIWYSLWFADEVLYRYLQIASASSPSLHVVHTEWKYRGRSTKWYQTQILQCYVRLRYVTQRGARNLWRQPLQAVLAPKTPANIISLNHELQARLLLCPLAKCHAATAAFAFVLVYGPWNGNSAGWETTNRQTWAIEPTIQV